MTHQRRIIPDPPLGIIQYCTRCPFTHYLDTDHRSDSEIVAALTETWIGHENRHPTGPDTPNLPYLPVIQHGAIPPGENT